MRSLLFAVAGLVASSIPALAQEGDAALTCPMSDGSTVFFVRHSKTAAAIVDNFEFYDSQGRISQKFSGRESDDKYRYSWGTLAHFGDRKTEYVYEIDRYTLEIEATFQSVLEDGVKRLTGRCSHADFKKTVATVAELKARHAKEAEEREREYKRKQELETQERLSRRKL